MTEWDGSKRHAWFSVRIHPLHGLYRPEKAVLFQSTQHSGRGKKTERSPQGVLLLHTCVDGRIRRNYMVWHVSHCKASLRYIQRILPRAALRGIFQRRLGGDGWLGFSEKNGISFMLSSMMYSRNKCILQTIIMDTSEQCNINEWSIRLIPNRFCSFSGHWSLEDALFPTVYCVGGLLFNRRISRSGQQMAPIEKVLWRLELYLCWEKE